MGFPGALFSSFYHSFPLMGRNRRIKAKTNGPPHSRPKCLTLRSRSTFCEGKRQAPLGEGQAFSSSFGQAPLPFWPGPRALPGRGLAFPHTASVVFTFTLNDTLPPPNPHGGPRPAISYALGTHFSSSLRVIANKVSDSLWASHPRRFAPDCRFASLRGTKQSR